VQSTDNIEVLSYYRSYTARFGRYTDNVTNITAASAASVA
jgi:hypothetical protein